MSSEYDFIESLYLASTYLYEYGGPILVALGTLSCVLNVLVFTKKILRKNPCSIYFVALNISNILLIYQSLLFNILQAGYNINPAAHSLPLCRFYIYAALVFDILGPFYLILASIDRVLITSYNALTRRRSTQRLAYVCIISGTIFWMLVHTHGLVFGSIVEVAPNYFSCYFQPGAYLAFIAYYSFLVKGILVPFFLIMFGIWSIINIRSIGRRRVAPAMSATITIVGGGGLYAINSKDRQLVLILLTEISLYMIFSWMEAIFLMYEQLTQYNTKSLVQSQIELFISDVGGFSYYIPFCIGFYTNLLVSKTFRSEVKKILFCK